MEPTDLPMIVPPASGVGAQQKAAPDWFQRRMSVFQVDRALFGGSDHRRLVVLGAHRDPVFDCLFLRGGQLRLAFRRHLHQVDVSKPSGRLSG